MAEGDANDAAARQNAVLPVSWFPPALADVPVLRSVLAMPSALASWLWGCVAYARAQMRLATATDGWLDLAALDFTGTWIRRRAGEGDAALRTRLQAEILRERVTRAGLRRLLLDLTGYEPRIFEPARPADTGAYGVTGGYGVAGGWGSLAMPAQFLVDVVRNPADVPAGLAVTDPDPDLLAAVARVIPAGTVAWVRSNSP